MRKAVVIFAHAAFMALAACHQQVPPIQPEPGLPCGRAYILCPETGGCCHATQEYCGRAGNACGLGDCCYAGTGGTTWGSGRPRKQLTPEQVRAIELGH